MEVSQIIALIIGALLLIGIVLAAIFKKDYLKFSTLAIPVLTALCGVLKAVGNIFPNSGTISTIVLVISTAIEAAGHAENLWLQGEIDKGMRPQLAQSYIQNILTCAGIEITDNIKSIISGVIAATCYLMPHYTNNEEEG